MRVKSEKRYTHNQRKKENIHTHTHTHRKETSGELMFQTDKREITQNKDGKYEPRRERKSLKERARVNA